MKCKKRRWIIHRRGEKREEEKEEEEREEVLNEGEYIPFCFSPCFSYGGIIAAQANAQRFEINGIPVK